MPNLNEMYGTSNRSRGRRTRMPRFPFANSAAQAEIFPLAYHLVLPGETMTKAHIQGRMVSEPLAKILVPAYWEMYLLYVPFRLVFDGWVDFMTSDDPAAEYDLTKITSESLYPPNYPSLAATDDTSAAAQAAAKFFMHENTDATYRRNVLLESCVKYAQNVLFQHDKSADTGFAYRKDADTDTILSQLPQVDQLTEFGTVGDLPNVTVPADIASLKEAERDYALQLRAQQYDDTYVERLAMYGVSLQRGLIEVPETLMKSRNFIYPSRTVGNADGKLVGQYQHDFDRVMNRPKSFPEHGYVIAIAALRPEIFRFKQAPLEAYRGTGLDFHLDPEADARKTLASNEWFQAAAADNVSLNTLMFRGEYLAGDCNAGPAASPPDTPVPYKEGGGSVVQPVDSDLWDYDNFQWTNGTDAQKERRVAWTTGVYSTHIKTRLRDVEMPITMAQDGS